MNVSYACTLLANSFTNRFDFECWSKIVGSARAYGTYSLPKYHDELASKQTRVLVMHQSHHKNETALYVFLAFNSVNIYLLEVFEYSS